MLALTLGGLLLEPCVVGCIGKTSVVDYTAVPMGGVVVGWRGGGSVCVWWVRVGWGGGGCVCNLCMGMGLGGGGSVCILWVGRG